MWTIGKRPPRSALIAIAAMLLTGTGAAIGPKPVQAASVITIESPANGTTVTGGTVTISGTYAGLYDVKLVIDGLRQADVVTNDPDGDRTGTWTYELNTAQYGGEGEVVLRAKGSDTATRSGVWSDPVTLRVDHAPSRKPRVTVTSPADGAAVSGVVPVRVAIDSPNPMSAVQVRIGGGPWQTASWNGTEYETPWNSAGLGDKTVAIEAKATDTFGNTGLSMTTYAKTGNGTSEPVVVPRQDRAMWIWEPAAYNLYLNPGSRTVLDAFAKDTATFGSEPVTTLYIAVGGYDGIDILEDKPDKARDFLTWAHANGYQVHALIAGGTSPPYLGAYARYHDRATREVEKIINFNLSSAPEAGFDGVNVDIEPYISPDFKSPDQFLQKEYLDGLSKLMQRRNVSGTRLAIGPAIPRWYDTSPTTSAVDWNGAVKPLSEHVQDISDYISIMDYRDAADGSNGIIASAQGEIDYAASIGKPNSVVVGVETLDVANTADPYTVTFRQKGRTEMERELDKVYAAFGGSPSFGGVAVHHYDSYRALPSYWGPEATLWSPPPDAVPPSAVSRAPVASAIDYQQISIRFGMASDNTEVDRYNIYRSTTSGFAPSPSNLAGTTRSVSFLDTGLLADTTYYYKVAAVDVRGNVGPASAEASARTGTTSLTPIVVNGMKVAYNGTGATVTLKVADYATGQAVPSATVGGRFTYSGGKFVTVATNPDGVATASSEPIAAGRQVGFMPRSIDAPGHYWAKAYDRPPAATVYPDEGAGLTGLALNVGTWNQPFVRHATTYTVQAGHADEAVTVTPTAASPVAAITVNGSPVASGSASAAIPLAVGSNPVVVEVTERDGAVTVYTVTVIRAEPAVNVFPMTEDAHVFETRPTERFGAAPLLEVADIPGSLGGGDRIAFMKADFGSFAGSAVNEAKLVFYVDEALMKPVTLAVDGYAQASWSESTIDWNNRPKAGSVPLGTVTVSSAGWYAVDVTGFVRSRMDGDRKATFRLTDPGTKNTVVRLRAKEYADAGFRPYLIVNPSQNPQLQSLAVGEASIEPAFSPDVSDYRASVTHDVYAVRITPTAAEPFVKLTVNGVETESGRPSAPVPLQVGDNPIEVRSVAQNGQAKSYTVTVRRTADSRLSGLALSDGTLAPSFSPERTAYTVDVFAGVPKIRVSPIAADGQATVTVNGEPVASGQSSRDIKLAIGANPIEVVVTATDGTSTAYAITVHRVPPGRK
ncbi:cadherin-like beta sandwich domain-containing protein [Paenibacillus flagellatus]|uniref:Fibronectin type-III domain-containing protein n=1 Tax=Paenibacillus flagellatus TaxID=2211139 RepID=A0A2V5KJU3_9BACL|nr:cadherin-like beta sandwich domain-containing protein [Paenibacillus flagellatus]PYI54940.1 hypothetical protein DLM86_10350 [Paenibacillus flagellatus]